MLLGRAGFAGAWGACPSSGAHSVVLREMVSLMGTCVWAPQAKEERLAEEKAKKKAAAKKMEEMEVRRKQEEEARRLKWLQQVRVQVDRGAWAPRKRWGRTGCLSHYWAHPTLLGPGGPCGSKP